MPAEAPYQRIVSMSRVRVMFAIPLEEKEFARDLGRSDVDFVRNCCLGEWLPYKREVIQPARRMIKEARRFGARVITDASLGDWGAMFGEPLDVVILITHWLGDTIEFRDGMHSVSDVVGRMPAGFNGAIDLCVCHPEPLAVAIRDDFPEAVAHFPAIPANPRTFFPYIRALLWRLSAEDCAYLTAAREIIDAYVTAEPADRRKTA